MKRWHWYVLGGLVLLHLLTRRKSEELTGDAFWAAMADRRLKALD